MEILTLIFITYLILLFTGVFILLYLGMWGLTIKPVITLNQDNILAQSSKIYLFLTSFLCNKNLKIDKTNSTLTLSVRKCWILNCVKKIRFNEINKIKYDYISHWRDRHGEKTEEFVVSLILRNNEEVKLFSFIGNESSGSQEASSREFVELISAFMDKKLI